MSQEPVNAVMFEPVQRIRKPWKDLRRKIEDAAREQAEEKSKRGPTVSRPDS